MSEPKPISPMLDGCAMGSAISTHHGVCCYPALDLKSEHKYIVKVITIPASSRQLDALLLSGAYPDKESASSYFKELAEDTVTEAEILQRLARLEGFCAYDSWQIIPSDDGIGYEVYLKGTYRPTLRRFLSHNPMTHLAAVNLGLDLCAALSACRRSGYLFINLKPGNIFICEDREYRIGDLGFVALSSLRYASLPDKYRSSYTAPEITDAYSSLNTTLDTYAAGLILYQIYNNGQLPFSEAAPEEPLPPPPYADYEMAEIILKACAPNPEDRWEDPAQMGQALVSYLQRNEVNDIPIIPPVVPVAPETDAPAEEAVAEVPENTPSEEPAVQEAPEAVSEETLPENTEESPAEAPETAEAAVPEVSEETAAEVIAAEVTPAEETEAEETSPEAETTSPEEAPTEETPEETTAPEEASAAEEASADDALSVLDALLQDETAPTEETVLDLEDSVLSEETSQMLAQADELIAHELPAPAVAPESIEIPMPAPIVPEDAAELETPNIPESGQDVLEEATVSLKTAEYPDPLKAPDNGDPTGVDILSEDTPESELPQVPGVSAATSAKETEEDDTEDEILPQRKKKPVALIVSLVLILLLLLAGLGGYYYYNEYYLQSVEGITLQATENRLTVLLDTQTDNSLLTVSCTDSYGNVKHSAVTNNTALFENLRPDTSYKISVKIDGFHELIGVTTGTHTTAAQTLITGFTAVTGPEDGSVILNFTVQGPESSAWRVRYSALGEDEKSVDFTGHMVTVTGLKTGKQYTFTLEPATTLYLDGTYTLKYTATKIIYAEELTTLGFQNGTLTATWKAPYGSTVNSWTVRCYNDAGFDTTIIVTEPKAAFENLDPAPAYTIEVTAEGMTVGTRTYVSANSITFREIQAESTDRKSLKVTWGYEGTAPKDGWLVMYTVDGSSPHVIQCESSATSAVISPMIPGAHYDITIQPTGGGTVYGGTYTYNASVAPMFSGYWVTSEHMVFNMCKRPDIDDWDQSDVLPEAYTTAFHPGETASFVIQLNHEYTTSSDKIDILFVVRNANGNPVSFNTITRTWTYMWYKGIGLLDVPALPDTPGSYTLEIYYNGASVTTQTFTIV